MYVCAYLQVFIPIPHHTLDTTLRTRFRPRSGRQLPFICPSFTPPLVNSVLPATKTDWAFSPPLVMTRRKASSSQLCPALWGYQTFVGGRRPGRGWTTREAVLGDPPGSTWRNKRWPDQDECSGTTIHHACTMRRERQGRQGSLPPSKVHQARRTLISLLQLGKFGHSLSRGKRQAAGKDSRRRFDSRAHGRSGPGVRYANVAPFLVRRSHVPLRLIEISSDATRTIYSRTYSTLRCGAKTWPDDHFFRPVSRTNDSSISRPHADGPQSQSSFQSRMRPFSFFLSVMPVGY